MSIVEIKVMDLPEVKQFCDRNRKGDRRADRTRREKPNTSVTPSTNLNRFCQRPTGPGRRTSDWDTLSLPMRCKDLPVTRDPHRRERAFAEGTQRLAAHRRCGPN